MTPDENQQILAMLGRIEARLAVLEDRTGPSVPKGANPPPHAASQAAPAGTRVPVSGNEEETWLSLPEERIAAIMAPFANEQRVKLLKALYMGISESGQLKDFTGLTGGQLYHHLKELALAKFLSRQIRGEYRLSGFGYYTFSAFMILAADLLNENLSEELVAPEEIGELE